MSSKLIDILTKECKVSKDVGLLIIRIIFGFVLFYGHGFEKLSVIFSGEEIRFMDPIGIGPKLSFYLAAFAEGICSILLILGLLARPASLILTLNFVVIFSFHAFMAGDAFNVLEMRYMYLFTYLALILTGPGKYSLDHVLFKKDALAEAKSVE